MKLVVVVIAALLVAVCDQPASNTPAVGPTSSSSNAETQAESGFAVKVTLNGAEFASYRISGPRTLVLNDGGVLTMFLSSNDNKNILTLHIQGTNTGTYPLPAYDGAPKQGEARMELMHDDKPPVRIPTDGEVRLEKFDNNQCSGSFKGTGTDYQGGKFVIEGSFSNLGVKTVD